MIGKLYSETLQAAIKLDKVDEFEQGFKKALENVRNRVLLTPIKEAIVQDIENLHDMLHKAKKTYQQLMLMAYCLRPTEGTGGRENLENFQANIDKANQSFVRAKLDVCGLYHQVSNDDGFELTPEQIIPGELSTDDLAFDPDQPESEPQTDGIPMESSYGQTDGLIEGRGDIGLD